MSLRVRIALASALAVIVAFGLGGVVTYTAVSRQLYSQIDDQLRAAAIREARAAMRPDGGGGGGGGRDGNDFGGNSNGRFGGRWNSTPTQGLSGSHCF